MLTIFLSSFILVNKVIASNTSNIEKEETQSGIITFLEGKAQKKKAVSTDWINAHVQSKVKTGEKIKTLDRSKAELEINWDTVIRLSENTIVDLVKLLKNVNKKFEANIDVDQGEVWASVDKLNDESTFTIGDSIARAEIRGTTFRYSHSDKGTQLKVYSGVVKIDAVHKVEGPHEVLAPHKVIPPHEVSGPSEVSGPHKVSMEKWTVIVKSMQEVNISNGLTKPEVKNFKSSDPNEQSEWIQWNKERDKLMLNKRKGE